MGFIGTTVKKYHENTSMWKEIGWKRHEKSGRKISYTAYDSLQGCHENFKLPGKYNK